MSVFHLVSFQTGQKGLQQKQRERNAQSDECDSIFSVFSITALVIFLSYIFPPLFSDFRPSFSIFSEGSHRSMAGSGEHSAHTCTFPYTLNRCQPGYQRTNESLGRTSFYPYLYAWPQIVDVPQNMAWRCYVVLPPNS